MPAAGDGATASTQVTCIDAAAAAMSRMCKIACVQQRLADASRLLQPKAVLGLHWQFPMQQANATGELCIKFK